MSADRIRVRTMENALTVSTIISATVHQDIMVRTATKVYIIHQRGILHVYYTQLCKLKHWSHAS